ncbi:Dicer-like protein 2 [Mortierella sp. AM989]|nr:Dicer-like protein 2 [Mortierella sp. AM989]
MNPSTSSTSNIKDRAGSQKRGRGDQEADSGHDEKRSNTDTTRPALVQPIAPVVNYVNAVLQYCKILWPRLPIYSVKYDHKRGATCVLTSPVSAQCPAVQTIQPSKTKAVEIAALVQQGALDANFRPRATQATQPRLTFGNKELNEDSQAQLRLGMISHAILKAALTPQENNLGSSLWSAIGEAYMKFFLTACFFARYQDELEGTLTTRIQNELGTRVLVEYFSSRSIAPHVVIQGMLPVTSDSIAAETLRRIIGAAAVSRGVDAAASVVRSFGFAPDAATKVVSGIHNVYQRHRLVSAPLTTPMDPQTKKIAEVQKALGYKFKDVRILLGVLTHGPAEVSTGSEYFERLELLGDAVLEFAITSRCYVVCDSDGRRHQRQADCREQELGIKED